MCDRQAYILFLIATLAGYVGLPGKLAALILTILGYVRLLSGYRGLKRSASLSDKARSGAGLLFVSGIWMAVGYVIGWIPVIGDLIESIISFAVFFVVLAGWGRIRSGAPLLTESEAQAQAAAVEWSPERRSKALGIWMLSFVGLELIYILYFAIRSPQYEYVESGNQALVNMLINVVFTGLFAFVLLYKKLGGNAFLRIGAGIAGFRHVLSLAFLLLSWVIMLDQSRPDWFNVELERYASVSRLFIEWIGQLVFIVGVWRFSTSRFVKTVYTVGTVVSLALPWLMPVIGTVPGLKMPDNVSGYWVTAICYLLFFLLLLWALLWRGKKPVEVTAG